MYGERRDSVNMLLQTDDLGTTPDTLLLGNNAAEVPETLESSPLV